MEKNSFWLKTIYWSPWRYDIEANDNWSFYFLKLFIFHFDPPGGEGTMTFSRVTLSIMTECCIGEWHYGECCSSNHARTFCWASLYFSGLKTTLLTSVFFVLASVFFAWKYYADSFLRMLIQMFADVRWVGFLPPVILGPIEKKALKLCRQKP
jgi:hypothetical protein